MNSLTSSTRLSSNEFEKLCPLIFTITTYAYVSFAKNWVISLERHGMNDFLIICSDTNCSESLLKWKPYLNIKLMRGINSNNDSSKPLIFATLDYRSFVFQRPKIIENMYIEYINATDSKYNALLYLDSDIVMLNNFIPLLREKYLYNDYNIMYDIVLQNDNDKDVTCTDRINYCTCFMLIPFKEHSKISLLVQEWENNINIYISNGGENGNQQPFNMALNKLLTNKSIQINVGMLDCSEFPNGALISNMEWRMFEKNDVKHFQFIHANYLLGPQAKLLFLQKYNVWYLNINDDMNNHIRNDLNNETNRGMSYEQYTFIGSTISFSPNMIKYGKVNILIFSIGYDSLFYSDWNKKGKNVYLEDSQSQVYLEDPIKQNVFKIKYTKSLHQFIAMNMEIIKLNLLTTFWDVIIVDPFISDTNAMQSIYLTSYLMNNSLVLNPNGTVNIFIHDCGKDVESIYSKLYISDKPTLIIRPQQKSLAYYKITTYN